MELLRVLSRIYKARSVRLITCIHHDCIFTNALVSFEPFNLVLIDCATTDSEDRFFHHQWVVQPPLSFLANNRPHFVVPDVFADPPLGDLVVVLLPSKLTVSQSLS